MNKNILKSSYESGEIVFGIQSPGPGWVKLDGSTVTVSLKLAAKLNSVQPVYLTSFATSPSVLAYGNGTWVAGGVGGFIQTSTDVGVTWTTQASNFTTTINSIAYGNGTWVAMASAGGVQTSTDAINWNTQTAQFSNKSLIYGNGIWAAITPSAASASVRTSTDGGVTWTSQPALTPSLNWTASSIAYGNGSFVVGGYSLTGATNFGIIKTSTDSQTWRTWNPSVAFTTSILNIAYGNGVWVGTGTGATIITSTDLVMWTTRAAGATVNKAIYTGNLWLAYTTTGNARLSTDTITWSSAPSFSTAINAVAYGNGTTLVATASTALYSLSPATSYTTPVVNPAYNIYGWMKL